MDVSVIIVSWNVEDLLKPCLDSLWASGLVFNGPEANAEVIVVDSGRQISNIKRVWIRQWILQYRRFTNFVFESSNALNLNID